MELTAFNAHLGERQGRLPDGGDYVFILGDVEPGQLHELAPGDYALVEQALDVTDVDFVRAQMRLTVPASTPEDLVWEASISVDGVLSAKATCRPGHSRVLTDLAANVSKRRGVINVGVRLSLWSA